MLDIRRIRQNPQELRDALAARGREIDFEKLLQLDELHHKLLLKAEEKKTQRNTCSKKIGIAKRKDDTELSVIMAELHLLNEEIAALDNQIADLAASMKDILITLPNYPHASVPTSIAQKERIAARHCGTPRSFPWEPKTHRDIGTDLEIMGEENAAGASYSVCRGLGARLHRSIVQFLLNACSSDGYEETFAFLLGNQESIAAAAPENYVYSYIQEVSQTRANPLSISHLYQDKILCSTKLPIWHCAYTNTPCAESIKARGISRNWFRHLPLGSIRLDKIVPSEQSYDELEHMTASVEKVLHLLDLPYRVVTLSADELGFAAAKSYSIEVWIPSCNQYVEIASCSNCEEYQARRLGIRYRTQAKEKPRYAHTLEGSIAIGPMIAAILENNQNEDGTVTIPDALLPYMGTNTIK